MIQRIFIFYLLLTFQMWQNVFNILLSQFSASSGLTSACTQLDFITVILIFDVIFVLYRNKVYSYMIPRISIFYPFLTFQM